MIVGNGKDRTHSCFSFFPPLICEAGHESGRFCFPQIFISRCKDFQIAYQKANPIVENKDLFKKKGVNKEKESVYNKSAETHIPAKQENVRKKGRFGELACNVGRNRKDIYILKYRVKNRNYKE